MIILAARLKTIPGNEVRDSDNIWYNLGCQLPVFFVRSSIEPDACSDVWIEFSMINASTAVLKLYSIATSRF